MKKINMKTVFLCSTAIFFALNIVGIIIFRNNVNLSTSSFFAAPLIFIFLLIRGVMALVEKNDRLLLLNKHYVSKFYRYNRPTEKQLKDFYIKATVYFAVLPFYLPVALFSSKNTDSLWCLLLLFIPQFAIVGIEFAKMMLERKEMKRKEELWEKEKQEQEKREELGRWK